MNKGKKILSYFIILMIGIVIFCYDQNNHIVISYYSVENKKIPDAFHDYKILQISDLHSKIFGKNQQKLIQKTNELKPDIIVITGDLIDSHKLDLHPIKDYIKEAVNIAPIYFVSGNHEEWSNHYEKSSELLISYDVKVLDDKNIEITQNDKSINLIGLKDIAFYDNQISVFKKNLQALTDTNEDSFNILLSHRPELMDMYSTYQVDLVLSGHAHGGQIRIPFVGGVIAPNQGFLPQYAEGIHVQNNTTLIISRGLGNSIIPLRLLNRPELVLVTLK